MEGWRGDGPLVELQAHTIIWGNGENRREICWASAHSAEASQLFYHPSPHPGRRCNGQRANCHLPLSPHPSLSSGLLPVASHYACRDQREGKRDDEGREKNINSREENVYPLCRVTFFSEEEKRGRVRAGDSIEEEEPDIPSEGRRSLWYEDD